MKTHFVRAELDIYCDWQGIPPVYRIYVNDELFTERTWNWPVTWHLTQILQIKAPRGEYSVRIEPMQPCMAKFTCDNFNIVYGPARWIEPGKFKVYTRRYEQDEIQ